MKDERDLQRRAYLAHVIELLRGPMRDDIVARAHHVLDLWEASPGVRTWYWQRWRELLAADVDTLRAAVLGNDSEAEELRHCMPFAGILSNAERAAIRAQI